MKAIEREMPLRLLMIAERIPRAAGNVRVEGLPGRSMSKILICTMISNRA